MKRFLLTTAAVTSLFAASSALAAGPTVTLGGFMDFQVGAASSEDAYEGGTNTFDRSTHSRTDTELHVAVDGKNDAGLGYGAYIELEADVNGDPSTGNHSVLSQNAERAYLYLESGFGRVEVGPNTSASEALKVDASSFARATGGIAGDFYNYADLTGSAGTADAFIITPDLPTSGFPGSVAGTHPNTGSLSFNEKLATANKITYYTPRISGVQGGLSYTPSLHERGTAAGFAPDQSGTGGVLPIYDASSLENVWNLGLNYQGQFDNVGVNLGATGEFGDAEYAGQDDLRAYQFGGSVNYAGFTAGGSYALIDETGGVSSASVDGNFWTLGAAYEYGPFGASVTYLDSELDNASNITSTGGVKTAEFQNISVGADYQLAPGLVPYVEVSFFESDDNTADKDNEGTVFLVGSELNF